MTAYSTFEIMIAGANNMPKFLRFNAIDSNAAVADVKAAYGDDVEIWCVTLL